MNKVFDTRYYPLIQAIIKHGNIASSGMNDLFYLREDLTVRAQEWMVVEMIVEQRQEYRSIIDLSRMSGIPPSTFFRIVNRLQKAGFVDKYHVRGNRKNIVLRPTELALNYYENKVAEFREIIWGDFCQELEGISDSDIIKFTNAINRLNDRMPSVRYTEELDLIKVE